jgi:DNA primase
MEIKTKPDILATLHREGLSPKQRGRDYWLSCPFHSDKTPSLKVNPDRQSFHCFSCNEGGDVIAFIQKFHNLTFKEALERLNLKGNQPSRITPQKQTKQDLLKDFKSWERAYYQELCRQRLAFEALTRDLTTIEQVEQRSWIFDELPRIEYQLDILFNGNDEQKYELYQGATANGNEAI